MTTIIFTAYNNSYTATPEFGRYPNGRLAIRMVDEEDGSPVCTLTTNLPDQHLNEGEVFIKHWAENQPIFDAMMEFGWLRDTGREVISAYVEPKAMTLDGPLAEAYRTWTE